RLHGQFFRTVGTDRTDPGIVPHGGTIAPRLAKTEAAGVRRCALLEYAHQLVLRAVERAHPAVRPVPHAHILQLGDALPASCEQLGHVAPGHADVGDGAVAHDSRNVAQRLFEECHELLLAHLARRKGELAMLDRAETT